MAVAQLDTAKFAKVQALYREGATAGERQAASSRMDAMAKAAGMTTLQAAAATAKASGRTDPIAEAQAAAQRQWESMRSKPDSVRRRARMAETYGSEEAAKAAIFKDTPHEAALRAAVLPFRVAKETTGWKIGSLMGWQGGGAEKLATSIVDAIKRAVPMPNTVRGLQREYMSWRDLGSDRDAIDPYYDDPDFVRARMALLDSALDRMPATTPDDVMARLDWMQHQWDVDAYRDVHDDLTWMATLRDDLSRMMGAKGVLKSEEAPKSSPSGHSTAAGRRKFVLSIMDAEGDTLSDREIARRTGVSPTTVGKLRRERP